MPYVVTQTKTLITSFLTQASGFSWLLYFVLVCEANCGFFCTDDVNRKRGPASCGCRTATITRLRDGNFAWWSHPIACLAGSGAQGAVIGVVGQRWWRLYLSWSWWSNRRYWLREPISICLKEPGSWPGIFTRIPYSFLRALNCFLNTSLLVQGIKIKCKITPGNKELLDSHASVSPH